MNITDKSAIRKCTSCQMCGAVCARGAIEIRLNEEGFYRPYVDESTCTDCGLCTRVCYKFDNEIKITSQDALDKMETYAAQSLSDELLQHVTSGGVADALAKELIRQGYTCIGVNYNDDHHLAEHVVAASEQETDVFRGSKYIQSYSFDAFKTLVKTARTTKYAVFGLPCHIYAVDRFLTSRKLRNNCILVDLFCHGCPSMHIWNKYEKRIKKSVQQRKFDEVQFRSKVRDWGSFYVVVVVEGVKAFVSKPSQDEFYSLFFSDHALNASCSDCLLRSTMEYTDIRLGDFWGKRYVNDRKGVSTVAIASERGSMLFNAVKNQFRVEKRTMAEVNLGQSYGKIYPTRWKLRKKILSVLADENRPLSDAVDLFYRNAGWGMKAKRLLKTINWYLPFDLKRLLKRLR
ncbi:MAG: 4Fe-4S dicluster domain-containing protein [Erysipelotrichia bacterium]|nr:4Fe-4S dicluster domain-containing protein [Erysipelotrichia bacterium]